MRAGELPVSDELKNQDWDAVIAAAEEHMKDAQGLKRTLPTIKQIAKKCGLEKDYKGSATSSTQDALNL